MPIFNKVQPNLEELCDLIKVRVAMRMKANLVGRDYLINQFESNLENGKSREIWKKFLWRAGCPEKFRENFSGPL